MTENTSTEATTEVNETTEVPAEDQPQESPNAEAARYRHRAKEAEQERDALADQVTALRRAAVDVQVKKNGITPDGFWASGVDVDDLLDEGGAVDDEKVRAQVVEATKLLGLSRFPGPYVPKEGNVTNPNPSHSWENAFKG